MAGPSWASPGMKMRSERRRFVAVARLWWESNGDRPSPLRSSAIFGVISGPFFGASLGVKIRCGAKPGSHGLKDRLSCSPSPRPSPSGRGRIVVRQVAKTAGLLSYKDGPVCSLSHRERAGVRGKRWAKTEAPKTVERPLRKLTPIFGVSPNPEVRTEHGAWFRISDFGFLSGLGFRASDFLRHVRSPRSGVESHELDLAAE